jgi:methylated-DNA-[protein]-cysteine S-methyltransferase
MTVGGVTLHRHEVASPLGPILAASDGRAVVGIDFLDGEARLANLLRPRFGAFAWTASGDGIDVAGPLDAYFAGDLAALDRVPADPGGTPFQAACWTALRAIPAGATLTYAAFAARLGRPRAVRAVGHANARNPISLVIPCHRLVGGAGALRGYAGGLARKRWLLAHEGAHLTTGSTPPEGEPERRPG